MRRTGRHAGRVEAVQAAVGFNDGRLRGERRVQVSEALRNFLALPHRLSSGPHQVRVHIGPSVAEELPGLSHFGDLIQIEIGRQHLILVARREDKLGSVIRSAVGLNYAVSAVIIGICYIFAWNILGAFITDPNTLGIAHGLLMITLWS